MCFTLDINQFVAVTTVSGNLVLLVFQFTLFSVLILVLCSPISTLVFVSSFSLSQCSTECSVIRNQDYQVDQFEITLFEVLFFFNFLMHLQLHYFVLFGKAGYFLVCYIILQNQFLTRTFFESIPNANLESQIVVRNFPFTSSCLIRSVLSLSFLGGGQCRVDKPDLCWCHNLELNKCLQQYAKLGLTRCLFSPSLDFVQPSYYKPQKPLSTSFSLFILTTYKPRKLSHIRPWFQLVSPVSRNRGLAKHPLLVVQTERIYCLVLLSSEVIIP